MRESGCVCVMGCARAGCVTGSRRWPVEQRRTRRGVENPRGHAVEHVPTISNTFYLFRRRLSGEAPRVPLPTNTPPRLAVAVRPPVAPCAGGLREWAEREGEGVATDDRALPTRLAYASVRKPFRQAARHMVPRIAGAPRPASHHPPAGRLPESQAPCTNTGCVLCVRPHSFDSLCSFFLLFFLHFCSRIH